MARPTPPQNPVKTSQIVFTGGLNERVSNLELTPGELYDVSNYQEMSGRYHGYASIKGYERYDGRTAPSDASFSPVISADEGNDKRTCFLLESTTSGTLTDLSYNASTLLNGSSPSTISLSMQPVAIDSSMYKFDGASWNAPTGGTVGTANNTDFQLGTAKTFDAYFSINTSGTGAVVIAKKYGDWVLGVDSAGNPYFSWYEGTVQNTLTSTTVLRNNAFTHVRVVHCGSGEFKIMVNGLVENTSSGAGTPDTTLNDMIVFGVTPNGFWLDSFRISTIVRSTNDFTVPEIPFSDSSFFMVGEDDTAREEQRGLITDVMSTTNTAEGDVLDVYLYEESAYTGNPLLVSARKRVGSNNIDIYSETTSGWVASKSITTSSSGSNIKFCSGRFSDWESNDEILFWICSDDTTNAFYWWNGSPIGSSSPIAAGTGILPAAGTSPIGCYAHDNRLFLLYPNGELYISGIGDPTLWTGSTDNASLYSFPSELLEVVHIADNTVAIFLERGIDLLRGTATASDAGGGSGWVWDKVSFNRTVDVVADTIQKLGNTIYFVSKQGLLSMDSSDVYGNFSQATLSHKVNNTLLLNIDSITGSCVSKEFGQYRVYFGSSALFFTFNPSGYNNPVKGSTKVTMNDNVICMSYSPLFDKTYFGSDDGFVYQVDSGESFDDGPIVTNFKSAYTHYGSPRMWKLIQSILLEMDTPAFIELTVKVRFGYDRSDLPKGESIVKIIKAAGGRWGISTTKYASFVWGGSVIGNPIFYPYGMGNNFSIEISTSERVLARHIVNNALVDYQLLGRQT